MTRDTHAARAHDAVLLGLKSIQFHVALVDDACLKFLNGSDEKLSVLLPYVEENLLSVQGQVRDSLMFLKESGAISTGGALDPDRLPEIPEGQDGYEDAERKAVASLVGAIGEIEQQIYSLVHSVDRGDADVRQTEDTLMMIGYLTSIALERAKKIGDDFWPGRRGQGQR
jgi:hypothetical protein